ADARRPVCAAGRIHPVWRNGVRVLHAARTARLLADPERWGARGALLFSLALLRRGRTGTDQYRSAVKAECGCRTLNANAERRRSYGRACSMSALQVSRYG